MHVIYKLILRQNRQRSKLIFQAQSIDDVRLWCAQNGHRAFQSSRKSTHQTLTGDTKEFFL